MIGAWRRLGQNTNKGEQMLRNSTFFVTSFRTEYYQVFCESEKLSIKFGFYFAKYKTFDEGTSSTQRNLSSTLGCIMLNVGVDEFLVYRPNDSELREKGHFKYGQNFHISKKRFETFSTT